MAVVEWKREAIDIVEHQKAFSAYEGHKTAPSWCCPGPATAHHTALASFQMVSFTMCFYDLDSLHPAELYPKHFLAGTTLMQGLLALPRSDSHTRRLCAFLWKLSWEDLENILKDVFFIFPLKWELIWTVQNIWFLFLQYHIFSFRHKRLFTGWLPIRYGQRTKLGWNFNSIDAMMSLSGHLGCF